MPSKQRATRSGRLGIVLPLVAWAMAVGCSGGTGCGGCGQPLSKPIKFPIDNGIQLRVTNTGFDFIEQNLRPILNDLLPDGLRFCVPGQCGGSTVTVPNPFGSDWRIELIRYALCHNANGASCAQATPYRDGTCTNGCQLSMNLRNVDIVPDNARDRLRINLTLDGISTSLYVALNSDIVDARGACRVNVTSNSLPISAEAQLSIDPVTRRLQIGENLNTQLDLANLDLRSRVTGNLEICDPFLGIVCIPNICDLLDGILGLVINNDTIRTLILGFAQGPIASAVNGFADSVRCTQCGAAGQAACRPGSTCQSGKCVYVGGPASGKCVPAPLGTEAEFDAGSFVQAFSPGLKAILRFAAYAGGYVDVVNNGVSTGMITGFDAEPSTCVPDATPPPTSAVPRATVLDANTVPCNPGETACSANPTPYKAGVAVSERIFSHVFYGIYRSGLLCLNVSSETTEFLSTANFELFLPSLAKLTGGKNRPMMLHVRPTKPPQITFGTGRLRRDASGNLILENGMPVIEDPLLTLRIPDMKLVFHAMIDDRMVKLFDITVDVTLPLAVYFRPDGSMAPIVGDLSRAFSNTRVAPSAILAEEPDALGSVIDIALQQALPFLAGALDDASIQIPEVQGFRLVLDDRRLKAFEAGTPTHKFIGLFSELEYGGMRMQRRAMRASATLVKLEVPPPKTYVLAQMSAEGRPSLPRAAATIDLAATGVPADQLEWQWRLDRGPWSLFTPSTRVTIESPMLLLQGEHTVEVRARHKDFQTHLSEVGTLKVVVDTLPPKLRVTRDGTNLRLQSTDARTPAERLRHTVRVDQGPAQDLGPATSFDLAQLPDGPHHIHVTVRDEAGNEATETRVLATHGRGGGDSTAPGCGGAGCGVGGLGAAGNALPFLGLLGFLMVFRRRRDPVLRECHSQNNGRSEYNARSRIVGLTAIFFVLFASAGMLGCSDGVAGGGDGGVVPTRCLSDADCREGEKCLVDSGLCVPAGGCRTDEDCGPGQYCANDLDGDGRRDCAFTRCTADAECTSRVNCSGSQIAVCRDGACACAEPCGGACPEGKFCCQSANACQDNPMACVIACTTNAQCSSFGVQGRCTAGQCVCGDGYRLDVRAQGTVDNKTCVLNGALCACVENAPVPLGDIGRWSHATMAGSTLWVSAYSTTYGDLVAGRYDAMAGTFQWFWVDGMPSAPVTGAPTGPRGGVLEPGDDVGTDTRIVGTLDGTLHIAYHDVTNGKLKYARGVPGANGAMTFQSHTVDAAGTNGRYTSLVLDAAGKPAIAYMTLSVVDGAAKKSRARLARAKTVIPSGGADWDLVTLHELALPAEACGGGCPMGQVCAASGNTFACAATTNNCAPACGMGEACVGGACRAVNRGTTLFGLPEGTGLFNSLALGPDGRLWNAFYDRTGGNLMLVAVNGTAASAAQLIDGRNMQGDTGDVGQWASLAVDPQGRRHITYVNATTDELWYAVVEGNAATTRVIDTGLRNEAGDAIGPNNTPPASGNPSIAEEHLVGDDAKLILDTGGAVRIAYMDSTLLDLMYARLNPASGLWNVERLAGNEVPYVGAFGFHISHVKDGARFRIVNYKFNLKSDSSGLDVRFAP